MDNSDMNFEVDAMNIAMTAGKTVLVGLVFASLLGGCATHTSEDDFGNSVRRMIEAQKYIPPEQQNREIPVLNGSKAETVMKHYRTDDNAPDGIEADMGGYGPEATAR
ncbi:MAG: hypothetical protein R6X15_04920 [Pseudomonadota bacterium]